MGDRFLGGRNRSESPPLVQTPHATTRLLHELLRAHGVAPGPDDFLEPLGLRQANCGDDRLILFAVALAGRYRQEVALGQCRVGHGIRYGPTRSPCVVVPRYARSEEGFWQAA